MKRSGIIALIVIVFIIVGVIIWTATSADDNKTEAKSSDDDEYDRKLNFARRVADRLEKIQSEVNSELERLRLTREMQEYVDKKINLFLLITKVALGTITLSIFGTLLYNGMEVWTATLTASGIICLAVPVLTYFFFTEVMDVKELITWLTGKIKKAVYKKYGFDPLAVQAIEKSIAIKRGVWNGLKEELKTD